MNTSKIKLILTTACHLKPSQVFYRVWRRLGGKTRLALGYKPQADRSRADISRIPLLPELDFDPVFLARFDVNAILEDKICLLHHEVTIDWSNSWKQALFSPLWTFNLHYFEYLLPLANAYKQSGDMRYLDKSIQIIESWIASCSAERAGAAWDPYVISMRIVNWLAFYKELEDELKDRKEFIDRFNSSLCDQFVHLSENLEVDLLANHYLENLKALVILSCYFHDEKTLSRSLRKLSKQVSEQIFPDGMHFERSPMYQKIILEDLIRVGLVLEKSQNSVKWLMPVLQNMTDTIYSFEAKTSRTPLFNDSGDNIAKSKDALFGSLARCFNLLPKYKTGNRNAGYYYIEKETDHGRLKIVFDAGEPSVQYALGHAHCDGLSFEAFLDGVPIVVNCGTYAYQDETRLLFKSTPFHNAVMIDGHNQGECWADFRMARSFICSIKEYEEDRIVAILKDYYGKTVERTLFIEDSSIVVIDEALDPSSKLMSWFHCLNNSCLRGYSFEEVQYYAPEFGEKEPIKAYCCRGTGVVKTIIDLPE